MKLSYVHEKDVEMFMNIQDDEFDVLVKDMDIRDMDYALAVLNTSREWLENMIKDDDKIRMDNPGTIQ